MQNIIKKAMLFLATFALSLSITPVRIHADSNDYSVDYGIFLHEKNGWYINNNSILCISRGRSQ